MRQLAKITLMRTATAGVGLLLARTAFEICYRFDFYPEKKLADLTMGLLSDSLSFWVIFTAIAVAAWIAIEFAARRWLRPTEPPATANPQAEFVPLLEATRRVYEATRDTVCAGMARSEGSADDALKWYCHLLVLPPADGTTRLMTLTGARPPSRVREPIDPYRPRAYIEIREDEAVLVDYRGQLFANDLMVPAASIDAAIGFIQALHANTFGPTGNAVTSS